MLGRFLGEFRPSGKLSGNTLVLSLPDAVTPVVWSLDLAKDGHGSISIHADEESIEYILVYAAAKKGAPRIEIARYKERAKAIRALAKATDVLEKTSPTNGESTGGSIGHSGPYYAAKPRSLFKQILLTVFGIGALVLLFAISTGGFDQFSRTPLGQALTSPARIMMVSSPSQEQAAAPTAPRANPPKETVGVPMDADSFFGE